MTSFFSRLKSGLSKSSSKLGEGISGIFTKRKLDDEMLERLEEVLIEADMGATVAAELSTTLAKQKYDKDISSEEVKEILSQEISAILKPLARPLVIDVTLKPHVILVVGVNGNGKTTTIGKLAAQYKKQGKNVMLAAADTFRAAAVEQLQIWGQRSEMQVFTGEPNADPASVTYKALEAAKLQSADVLLIDTAGRLQNKSNLMAELQKIIKVIKKIDENAPHTVLQVLDATTGQNAVNQVDVFKEMIQVSGLIVTKLDGTAKGGILVALAKKFSLPIHAVGVGEGIEDLQAFDAEEFASSLVSTTA